MKYSDDDIRALIYSKSETPNLDFKLTAIWDRNHNEDRLEITKDILAMANTRDGGKIVLGVNDKTKEFVGLSEDAYNSFEVTKVNEFLHRYSDPVFTCEIIKMPDLEGKRVVIINIPEFKEDPIVCKENGHDSKNNLILIKGGIYIRTAKCSSSLVSSADEIRGIIERGLNKKSDELLAKIAKLLEATRQRSTTKGVSPYLAPYSEEALSKSNISSLETEVNEALVYFDQTIKREGGYCEVIAYPLSYNLELLENPAQAYEVIKQSIVQLRGLYCAPFFGHKNGGHN